MSLPETARSGSTVHHESWVAIVDDDASLRTALARALRSNGIRVETFSSGEDFLHRGVPGRPQCLVLDVHLGGMSGFEVQKRLATEYASLPIIFITAHDMFAERALSSGARGYLRKPFDMSALVALIRPHISTALSW